MIEASFGVVAWHRGEFDAARSRLEQAMAGLAAAGQQEIDVVWFQPNDPIATALLHLALARFVHGDLTGAEAELAQVAHRVEGLGFPQGPFSAAFAHFVEIWLRIEAGQLDRAAVLAADLIEQAERHGFDAWQLWGGTQQATVGALAALGAEDLDPTALSNHIATMTTFVDVLRKAGLNAYLTFFDSVLARLLIAAGQPDQARARLDAALRWPATPGCASTTPNCCGCAPTPTPTPTPAEPTSPPPSNWPAARAPPCSSCAPPSTISSCAANPPAPRSLMWSAASPPTAPGRNWHGHRLHWI